MAKYTGKFTFDDNVDKSWLSYVNAAGDTIKALLLSASAHDAAAACDYFHNTLHKINCDVITVNGTSGMNGSVPVLYVDGL